MSDGQPVFGQTAHRHSAPSRRLETTVDISYMAPPTKLPCQLSSAYRQDQYYARHVITVLRCTEIHQQLTISASLLCQ